MYVFGSQEEHMQFDILWSFMQRHSVCRLSSLREASDEAIQLTQGYVKEVIYEYMI